MGQEVVLVSANLTRLAAVNSQHLKTSLTFPSSKVKAHESKHGTIVAEPLSIRDYPSETKKRSVLAFAILTAVNSCPPPGTIIN